MSRSGRRPEPGPAAAWATTFGPFSYAVRRSLARRGARRERLLHQDGQCSDGRRGRREARGGAIRPGCWPDRSGRPAAPVRGSAGAERAAAAPVGAMTLEAEFVTLLTSVADSGRPL